MNRFLIDQYTYEWFLKNIGGIENLQYISINSLLKLPDFKSYNKKLISKNNIVILSPAKNQNDIQEGLKKYHERCIIATDLLKIGEIELKDRELNIYNLHLQFKLMYYNNLFFTISLGNLNTEGIR